MFVDKRKILLDNLGSGSTVDIALKTSFFPVDNSELVQTKFVDDEINNSINPTIDYKKVIFKPSVLNPITNQLDIINRFKINLNFYTPESITNGAPDHRGNSAEPGVYKDLGFLFDDVFCRTNRFVNSFVRFSLFDTPNSGQNELLSFADIYTQVGTAQENEFGFTLPIDECPISFVLGDPVTQPEEIHEGFQIYWFKDLVDNAPNKEYTVYGTVQFNSAINGRTYELAPHRLANPNNIILSNIEGEDGILYLKIILKNDNGVYKYRFVPNELQEINPPGVNMTPSSGDIPTLTFWQITP